MIATSPDMERYTEHYARLVEGRREPEWLAAMRRAASERFAALGFPTPRHEEWKYTDVRPIAQTTFVPAGPGRVTAADLERDGLDHIAGIRLVFVNGVFARGLSALDKLPRGVRAGSLLDALEGALESVEAHLGRYADAEQHAFAALNTALWRDGAFICIPRGAYIEEPIHLLYISAPGTEPTVSHPRALIIAEESSQATVLETYLGPEGSVYFTNAVTEVVCGPNAVLDHVKSELESKQAYHVAMMQVQLARDAVFTSQNISLGGALVRNDIGGVLGGENVEATFNGLYVPNGRQHIDNHTSIDHAMPLCSSHEVYKGIMSGHSTGVFNGKIFVRQDAQKTDAKQTNQNLLLSDDAAVNTKPQLEIYADDVRCTHGATIGQLSSEAVFYLRSRGIGLEEARATLTHAFAADLLDRVKVAPLRKALEARLMENLKAS